MAAEEIDERLVVFETLRKELDQSGYGNFVNDDKCRQAANGIVDALEKAREDAKKEG